jgi:hypothetical protein
MLQLLSELQQLCLAAASLTVTMIGLCLPLLLLKLGLLQLLLQLVREQKLLQPAALLGDRRLDIHKSSRSKL